MAVSFNSEADVLGLNFRKWSRADERELTDDAPVVRQAYG